MSPRRRPLEVMISSRSRSRVRTSTGQTETLEEVRVRAKEELEHLLPYGNRDSAFNVWIFELSEPTSAGNTWFEESIQRAEEADIVVALFSGDPGSVLPGWSQGVCHAELLAAYADAPTKVRVVDVRGALSAAPRPPKDSGPAWAAFKEEIDSPPGSLPLWPSQPQTSEEIVTDVVGAVSAATHELALSGIVASRRGSKSLGAALDWRRLSFPERKSAMEEAVLDAFGVRRAKIISNERRLASIDVLGTPVLFVVDAAPEGLGLASSRELVGQPQRNDHQLTAELVGGAVGPVHIVAVPVRATAAQARGLMGAADVITASFPAGIWSADPLGRAQILVITGCADEHSTRLQLDAALAWLRDSNEDELLVSRARRRAAIVRAMSEPDDLD